MQFSSDRNDDHAMAEINIVPLVDIMLVLLIIFMVTAPLSISGVDVALPKSKSTATAISNNSDKIILTIQKSGALYLEKASVDSQELKAKLSAIYSNRKNKDLYIRADKKVLYGSVVEAMSEAKRAGAQKITMLTEHTLAKK